MALLAGSASAINCYTVLDRSDNILYRGIIPPIDLSEKGQAERDAMRQRGQHLIAMDTDRCLGIEYFTGSAGSSDIDSRPDRRCHSLRGRSPGGNRPAVHADGAGIDGTEKHGATGSGGACGRCSAKRPSSSY